MDTIELEAYVDSNDEQKMLDEMLAIIVKAKLVRRPTIDNMIHLKFVGVEVPLDLLCSKADAEWIMSQNKK